MLYNRVKEHVVNDKKKMYKRGSQWVVVSAFAIALGGVAFTQVQPVSAATTESRLTVQPVTLTKQGQPTAASTQHEPASSIQSGQTTAQTTAAPSQAAVSQAAAPQQSVATYQDANSSTASTPTPSGMTEAEWQAQKAKYDQAKSSAAQSEAAATQKASEATASYASSLAAQSEAQTQRDQASLAAASSSATSSLAALQQQQDSSYAAASQSANAQIANLNSQRTSGEPTEQVSDGGTFDYVAEHGLWTNVVTYKDAGKTWDGKKIVTHEGSGKIWNGNYLVQNLPVFKDPNQAGLTDDLYDRRDDNQPSWSLGDTVKKNQLTDNQKSEINQYAMMLVNNYRESMGLNPVSTTQGFLNLVQQRGETLTNTNNTSHDPDIINSIFKYSDGADETIAPVDISPFTNYSESNPTMLEVMQGVAEAINGLFNYDGDSGQGHRGILLSDDIDAGFSLQYNTVQNAWVMNSNGSYKAYPGANILNVPSQTSTTPVQDNNKEIDQKIQQVKDNLQALKNTQDQQYQDAQANLRSSLQELADQFTASEAQTQKDNDSKLKVFEADQNQALATFIAELNKKVEAMNPGAKPVTPSSGASSSSASSSSASSTGSSASSSASSSSASSAGSSASSSASSSSASSAGSSASSSASSSSTSSAGSSASSSASSSSASSAGSSASSSAYSSSTSSAGSSASSSASSSSASSAGTTASSSTSSSSTSSAAVAPLGITQSTNPQPMSRMAQKNGKHAYPATGEGQTGLLLAEAGAAIIAVLGISGVRKARHAK